MTTDDSLVGNILKDTYEIEEIIGQGNAATIYRGTQLLIGRPVAIKVLKANHGADPGFVARFFREIETIGQFNHPNIVSIIDCGTTEAGQPFMVTEHLRGQTLKEFVPLTKGLPFDVLLEVFGQICAGVAEAHRMNLVHRDLKPANIFIEETAWGGTRVRVLDFGIVKPLGKAAQKVDLSITDSNVFLGTPGYLAPEQISDAVNVDVRCDTYSLGCLLYFMVSGHHPYSGTALHDVLEKQLISGPDPMTPEEYNCPASLTPVLVKALNRAPDDRYQTVDTLLNDLTGCSKSVAKEIRGRTLENKTYRFLSTRVIPTGSEKSYSEERLRMIHSLLAIIAILMGIVVFLLV